MIIHADMDAFFASVEILDKPHLADKPVAVGGPSRSRGVIAAANYIARNYGVRSALPSAIAVRRCPDLVLLKPRISLYADYSRKIKDIFARYTPLIEPLSLDEAFLEVSASEKLFGSVEIIANRIKQDIASELGLTISIGIAPSKFVAKIASDIEKPNGFVIVKKDVVQQFLDPLPITRIWGVGKAFSGRLTQRGINTIKDIRVLPRHQMEQWFGKHGIHVHKLACGIDDREVVTDREAKSISHETTFETNLYEKEECYPHLLQLTEMVAARLRHSDIKGRTISIKVRYADFKTITRAATLSETTNSTDEIWKVVKYKLFEKVEKINLGIRLLGVEVSQFGLDRQTTEQQLNLFSTSEKNTSKSSSKDGEKIDDITDKINQKFGRDALSRGTTIVKPPS